MIIKKINHGNFEENLNDQSDFIRPIIWAAFSIAALLIAENSSYPDLYFALLILSLLTFIKQLRPNEKCKY